MREARTTVADRTLDLLEAVRAERTASLPTIATRCGLPLPTVHRLARILSDRGYLIAYRRGAYGLGPAALTLADGPSLHDMLRQVGASALPALARRCGTHVHLGVYEGDMVTYLAKARFGRNKLPTAEGTQLEAYCSGIGKVLLAQLDEAALDRYLTQGVFVALTDNTVTDPAKLKALVGEVRSRGWGTDFGEVMTDLYCIAVPLKDDEGRGVAALSASFRGVSITEAALTGALPKLQAAAELITAKLWPVRRALAG